MSKERLTDKNGKTLGYIESLSNGQKILSDGTNRKLGSYDRGSNRTTDANNGSVGKGNLLTKLLR